jgi:DNA-directed RNA polymerase II subunit RPB1
LIYKLLVCNRLKIYKYSYILLMTDTSHKFEPQIKPIDAIDFQIWSNNDIIKGSTFGKDSIGVDTNDLYDKNNPRIGGLLDPRLGTTDNSIVCERCGLNANECPGHFGHITMAAMIFNMNYTEYIKKILGCICIDCSKLLIYKNEKEIEDMKKFKSGKRRLDEIKQLVKGVHYCQKKNHGCGSPVWNIKREINKQSGKIQMKAEIDIKKLMKDSSSKESGSSIISDALRDGKSKLSIILSPEKCYQILKGISDRDLEIMGIDPSKTRPEDMIHKYFPVPPVQVRPSVKADFISASSTMEDDLTHKLADIIRHNIAVRDEIEDPEKDFSFKNSTSFINLQYHGATYMNSEQSNLPAATQKGKVIKSLASRLKSKEGLIRGNLMGKRVNFSGRTVITPDPTIDINQLGVPRKIAMKVTYPEIVTPHNREWLQGLVRNGPNIYPGANTVIPLGHYTSHDYVRSWDLRFRKDQVDLKLGDVVERHLIDGDYVLLNRQPTLHKLSMMGHRAKIINNDDYQTLRLNPAVTKPYNADFDGDEMNVFVPQSDQAAIELEEIADCKRHIISPRNSLPIIGPVQDGILGAYNLTDPSIEIDWRTAMNIISYTSIDTFKNLKKKTYTGSELFSMIIPNGISTDNKGLKVVKGNIISGHVKKDHIGMGKENSLTHLIWDMYGIEHTRKFLDDAQRIVNSFNLYRGFTVGFRDIQVSDEIHKSLEVLYETKKLHTQHFITEMENNPDLLDLETFESQVYSSLDTIRDTGSKMIMENLDKFNNFNIMITSGSKGDPTNIGQMSGCLGQQGVEGARVKKRVNGRSLPHFHQNDDGPIARGFIPDPYSLGVEPESFIFHNMAAREGLIDTAIKTAQSGYVQRKLVKIMEDGMIKYDGTLRSSNNGIIQFVYGDSGINSAKMSGHRSNMYKMNYKELDDMYKFSKDELSKFKGFTEKENDMFIKKLKNMQNEFRKSMISFNQEYGIIQSKFMLPVNLNRLIETYKEYETKTKEPLEPSYVLKHLDKLMSYDYTQVVVMTKTEAENKSSYKYNDELVSKSMFEYAIHEWLAPKRCIYEYKFNKEHFDRIFQDIVVAFNKSIVEPGEMVGVIGAQSIGEPVTQMTLNSVDYYTEIMIDNNGTIQLVEIGQFIDIFMNNSKDVIYMGDIKDKEMEDTYYLDIKDTNMKVLTTSKDGKLSWNKVEAITKHLPMNKDGSRTILNVETRTGAFIKATKAKSFLTRINDEIVPVRGDELKIGSRIPLVTKFEPDKIITHINYYEKQIELTYLYGFLIGTYLATGEIKGNSIVLTNSLYCNEEFIKKITSCLNHLNISYSIEESNTCENINVSISIHDMEYINYIITECGENYKILPSYSYNATNDYIKGLIDGYMNPDDDMCELLDGIEVLHKRIGKCVISNDIIPSLNGVKLHGDYSREYLTKFLEENPEHIDREIIEKAINTEMIFDEIISISEEEPEMKYVYDLTVENNRNFTLSNGIIAEDTFHHTGIANMGTTNLGVGRMNELMSFSDKIKEPIMKIYLDEKSRGNKILANKIASYIKYTTVGDLTSNVEIFYDPMPYEKGSIMEKDNVKPFFTLSSSKNSCQSDVQSLPWLIRLEIDREKLLTNEMTMLEIKSKFCDFWSRRFTDSKSLKKEEKAVIDKVNQMAILSNKDNSEKPVIHFRMDIVKYTFNTIVALYEQVIQKFKLKGLEGIDNVRGVSQEDITIFDKDGNMITEKEYVIYTDGINIKDILYMNHVDLNRTYTNDVVVNSQYYGIEAARASLVKEMTAVVKDTNYQHMSVLIDMMTSRGALITVDRNGITKIDADPLARASFEKTVEQFVTASVFSERDHMNSVSSRIMAGQVIKGGTGLVDVVVDLEKIRNSEHVDASDKEESSFKKVKHDAIINEIMESKDDIDEFNFEG